MGVPGGCREAWSHMHITEGLVVLYTTYRVCVVICWSFWGCRGGHASFTRVDMWQSQSCYFQSRAQIIKHLPMLLCQIIMSGGTGVAVPVMGRGVGVWAQLLFLPHFLGLSFSCLQLHFRQLPHYCLLSAQGSGLPLENCLSGTAQVTSHS